MGQNFLFFLKITKDPKVNFFKFIVFGFFLLKLWILIEEDSSHAIKKELIAQINSLTNDSINSFIVVNQKKSLPFDVNVDHSTWI